MMLVDVAKSSCCYCLLSPADCAVAVRFWYAAAPSAAVSAALVSANILLGGSTSHGRRYDLSFEPLWTGSVEMAIGFGSRSNGLFRSGGGVSLQESGAEMLELELKLKNRGHTESARGRKQLL